MSDYSQYFILAIKYTFTHLWMAIYFNSTKADGKFDEKVNKLY